MRIPQRPPFTSNNTNAAAGVARWHYYSRAYRATLSPKCRRLPFRAAGPTGRHEDAALLRIGLGDYYTLYRSRRVAISASGQRDVRADYRVAVRLDEEFTTSPYARRSYMSEGFGLAPI